MATLRTTYQAQAADSRFWITQFPYMQDKAKSAAKHLYGLGVAAASDGQTITYGAAAASLGAAGRGYNNRQSMGPALDALAAYCAVTGQPDLSSVFTTKANC
jgi:hypothetical protein